MDATGRSVCATQAEQILSSGMANIDTGDLDRWGSFGLPATDPSLTRANGLDVFVVHHFTQNGVVGLSPRPGTALKGNGPGTALCIGAFLQQNGQISGPRGLDDMGVVLTHEIGHFLGLLHTTTFSPSPDAKTVKQAIDDGLDDTPAAGTLIDANADGIIGVGDGCADEGYIMFYQSLPTQAKFSPKQIGIIKTTLSALEH